MRWLMKLLSLRADVRSLRSPRAFATRQARKRTYRYVRRIK